MPELWQLDCYDQSHPRWFGETERVPCPVCGQPARAANRRRGKTLSQRVDGLETGLACVVVWLAITWLMFAAALIWKGN